MRALPELRRDLHDHVVLLRTEGIVDGRDLRLREAVPQRIVDLPLREPDSGRAVPVDDQIGLEPSGLQVSVHIGDLREVLEREAQLLRPAAQLVQVVAEQRVLIFRVGGAPAAAAADVLRGLQVGGNPGDSCELGSQPLDDLVRRGAALRPGFERHTDAAARSAVSSEPAAAHRSHHALNRRILLDDARDLLQLALHQLKGRERIPANASPYLARVLLRKETLRNDDIQINVQADRRQQAEQHQPRVMQGPVQGALVAAAQTLEAALKTLSKPAQGALPAATEQPGAHHRSRRQGNGERDQDGHRQGRGELPEQLAYQSPGELEGDEHRDQGQAHG